MKVKFKVHDPDFLSEYENIPDEVISMAPPYVSDNKWWYGELNEDDTITCEGRTFPIKLCQCVQVLPELKKYRVTYAYGEGRHLHTARVIVSALNEEDAIKIVKRWWSKTKFHKVEEIK